MNTSRTLKGSSCRLKEQGNCHRNRVWKRHHKPSGRYLSFSLPLPLSITPSLLLFFLIFKFILFSLLLVALGLHWGARAFSSFGEKGLLPSCGVWVSHCSGLSCCRAWHLGHGLSSYGTRAYLPRSMWDILGLEIGSMSLALAGRFLITREVPSLLFIPYPLLSEAVLTPYLALSSSNTQETYMTLQPRGVQLPPADLNFPISWCHWSSVGGFTSPCAQPNAYWEAWW